MNVYLIGYRCTGKTTVGRSLADALDWSFVDADTALQDRSQMTIRAMVDKKGWDYFREEEKETIRDLCATGKTVVATGGGAVLDKENVNRMRESGVLIWLKARPGTIEDRILADRKTEDQRPSLTGKGLLGEIREVLTERHPFYEEAMTFSIDTDGREIGDIAGDIHNRLVDAKVIGT